MEEKEITLQEVEFPVSPELIHETGTDALDGLWFENLEACRKYLSDNGLVVLNACRSVSRKLSREEIEDMRRRCIEEAEDVRPRLHEALRKAHDELDAAKEVYKNAQEMLSASTRKIDDLAATVKSGITDMQLEGISSWEMPVDSHYCILTYQNNKLKVANIRAIPEEEEGYLVNQSDNREILRRLAEKDDPAKVQETGTEKKKGKK